MPLIPNVDSGRIRQRLKRLDLVAFKFMILTALFFGSISPAFRPDEVAKYVGITASVLLTIIAGFQIFGRRRIPGNNDDP